MELYAALSFSRIGQAGYLDHRGMLCLATMEDNGSVYFLQESRKKGRSKFKPVYFVDDRNRWRPIAPKASG